MLTTTPTAAPTGDAVEALVSLTGLLVDHHDTADLLTHLTERAVDLLGVDLAGVLLPDASGRLELVASSSDEERHRELLDAAGRDDGPLAECLAASEPVVALHSGHVERRWPGCAAAMGAAGVAGAAATPLWWRGEAVGVLGVFSREPGAPGPPGLRLAQALADVAVLALLQDGGTDDRSTDRSTDRRTDRRTDRSSGRTAALHRALDARRLVEQAKGVLAAQRGTGVDDAARVLRRASQDRGVLLVDLAQEVVEGSLPASSLP